MRAVVLGVHALRRTTAGQRRLCRPLCAVHAQHRNARAVAPQHSRRQPHVSLMRAFSAAAPSPPPPPPPPPAQGGKREGGDEGTPGGGGGGGGEGGGDEASPSAVQQRLQHGELQHGELHHVFAMCDGDGDGRISEAELGMLLNYLGMRDLEADDVGALLRTYGVATEGFLTEAEFVALVVSHSANQQHMARRQAERRAEAAAENAKQPGVGQMGLQRWAGQKWQFVKDELWHYKQGLQMLARQAWLAGQLVLQVFNPLGRSFLKLEERDRRRLLRTAMDLARFAPFLALCLAPGGSVLVAALAKKYPGALPSTFQERSSVRGEEDVYEAVQSMVRGVRERQQLQNRADAAFLDFVAAVNLKTAVTMAAATADADADANAAAAAAVVAAVQMDVDAGAGAQAAEAQAKAASGSFSFFTFEQRLALAVAHSQLLARPAASWPLDPVPLLDNLSAEQLRAVVETMGQKPEDVGGPASLRLRQHVVGALGTLAAHDADLAAAGGGGGGVGVGVEGMDEEQLAQACQRRGIVHTAQLGQRRAALRQWVRVTVGDGGSHAEHASPLLAIICQHSSVFPSSSKERLISKE